VDDLSYSNFITDSLFLSWDGAKVNSFYFLEVHWQGQQCHPLSLWPVTELEVSAVPSIRHFSLFFTQAHTHIWINLCMSYGNLFSLLASACHQTSLFHVLTCVQNLLRTIICPIQLQTLGPALMLFISPVRPPVLISLTPHVANV
jgi:hypothetical protein